MKCDVAWAGVWIVKLRATAARLREGGCAAVGVSQGLHDSIHSAPGSRFFALAKVRLESALRKPHDVGRNRVGGS
jgi:hypothetical protein